LSARARPNGPVLDGRISVFLADDNLIVREGVRALLNLESDFEVVGVAGDYDELVSGAEAAAPQVIVTDIRMPPSFQREAIAAAQHTTPAAVSDAVEELFLKLAKEASAGTASGLRRLRMLHQAIVDREERGESLSRLLPGGVADMVQKGGGKLGETTEMVV